MRFLSLNQSWSRRWWKVGLCSHVSRSWTNDKRKRVTSTEKQFIYRVFQSRSLGLWKWNCQIRQCECDILSNWFWLTRFSARISARRNFHLWVIILLLNWFLTVGFLLLIAPVTILVYCLVIHKNKTRKRIQQKKFQKDLRESWDPQIDGVEKTLEKLGKHGAESNLVIFLKKLDLLKYLERFLKEDIDYETLCKLSETDLERIGIPLGARRKIISQIKTLNLKCKECELFLILQIFLCI